MRDLLPNEQTLRDYIQGKILETYRASGFERISTPMLEDMENLDKSDGGDNLNLIFKVLKRGDKLTAALSSGDPKELSDMGLRYDLTLPLSRFYAANKDKLPHPFKVIQTDRVFRAERPQKGRLREFVQCDIDILGDESPNAEVELIDVTTRALLGIGFDGFTVNINDRNLYNHVWMDGCNLTSLFDHALCIYRCCLYLAADRSVNDGCNFFDDFCKISSLFCDQGWVCGNSTDNTHIICFLNILYICCIHEKLHNKIPPFLFTFVFIC